MSEHKSNIESENERFEEAKAHDVRKHKNFAVDDIRTDEDFSVDDVRKGENFVENAVLSDARHDASTDHTQPDIQIETVSALSRTSEIILRSMDVRRRGNHRRNDDIGSTKGGGSEEEDGDFKKERNSERRKIFNMVKYIISIVLIILDLTFDWIQYSELNNTGNYSIVAERRMKNVEFTFDCEGNEKDIQFIFLIFTVVGTVMTVLQILNILYQIYYEVKGVYVSKILVHETVETFLFLFFIELSQLLLIMGFFEECTLDCIINKTEIVIALNGLLSFSKIIWRFLTRWEYCTFRQKRQVLEV